tara:strand:+ start:5447 stop:6250 length:804 start_codon:yes stop_codon:yes gene_type:complete
MKLGFILDSDYLPPDLEALVNASNYSNHFSIDLIISYAVFDTRNESFLQKAIRNIRNIGFVMILRRLGFNLIYGFESRMTDVNELPKPARHINDCNIPILRVKPIFSKSKFIVRVDDQDQEIIKTKNLDLLIRGGRHILRGGILDVCTFGVVGIHHGDNEKFRGLPSGFWEVYCGIRHTGYIFQRLCHELDDGIVFFKGQFLTRSTAFSNTDYLHKTARLAFLEFIEEVSRSKKFPDTIQREGELVPLYTVPTLLQLSIYIKRVHFS